MVRKLTTTLLFFLCAVSQLFAGKNDNDLVVGKVIDEFGQTVPYASVYFVKEPTEGVITNSEGVFTLPRSEKKKDNLVVSFIGFETYKIDKKDIPSGDTLFVSLKEQPILLQEAVVAKTKASKKMTKKQKRSLLEDVRAQIERDFPEEYVRYHIVSDYAIHNGDKVVMFEELVGNLVELPVMKKSGTKDSIQLKGIQCRRYRDKRAVEGLDYIEENTKKEGRKNLVQRVDSSVMIHRTMWGSGVKWFFDEIAKKPAKWEIVDHGDVSVLTYTDKRNFLGIVKFKLTMNYIIDPYSYSIQKISQDLYIYANIPFGYKLDDDMLAVFNFLNMGEEQVEKYRLKKVDGTIQRNVLYTKDDRRTFVDEKSVVFDVKVEDRKERGFSLHNTATINVLDAEAGVRPYTNQELNTKFPVIENTVSNK